MTLPRIQLCTPDPDPEEQSSSYHHLSRAADQAAKRQSGIPTISISTSKDGTESYAKEWSSAGEKPRTPTSNRYVKESTPGSKLASMLKKKTYQALSLGHAREKDTNAEQDTLLKPPGYDSVSSWNTAFKRRVASMPEPVSQPQSGKDVWPHADPLAARTKFTGSPPIVDFTRFEDRYRSSSRGDYDGLLAFSPGQRRGNDGDSRLRYSAAWNGQSKWDHTKNRGTAFGDDMASASKENSLERDTHMKSGVIQASTVHPSSERKLHPLLVIDSLAVIFGGTVDIRRFFNLDELLMIHEMNQKDLEAMTRERESVGPNGKENQRVVLGETIQKASIYASTTMILAGRVFILPIVVVHCVEELYRTGIYQPNLFRTLPNRPRLLELVSIFDSEVQPPGSIIRSRRSPSTPLSPAKGFGAATSLHLESTPDICALLTSYLSALPEPILPPYLFEPIWVMCGIEDVLELDISEPRPAPALGSFVPTRLSTVPLARSYTPLSEATSILAAQLLLHLLPSPHFSLLVYLLAFFSQVALVREENGVGVEDLSRMFGARMFGHGRGDLPTKLDSRSTKARGKENGKGEAMMVWFLRRWGPLSETLFDVVEDENTRSGVPYQTKLVQEHILVRSATASATPAACSALGANNAGGQSSDRVEEKDRELLHGDVRGGLDLSGAAVVTGSSHVNRPILSTVGIDRGKPTFETEFTTGPLASSSPKLVPGSAGFSSASAILPDTPHLDLESTSALRVNGKADAKHFSQPSVDSLSIDEEDSPWAKLRQLEAALSKSNRELPDSRLVPRATGGKWANSTDPRNNRQSTESAVDSETEIHERLLDISMPETLFNLEETLPLCEDEDEGTSKLSYPLSSSVLSLTPPVTPSPGYSRYCSLPVSNKFEQKSASASTSLTPNPASRLWGSERLCVPPRPPKSSERLPFDGSRPRLSRHRSHNNPRALNNDDPKGKDAIIDALRVQLIDAERERDEARRVVTQVRRALGDTSHAAI